MDDIHNLGHCIAANIQQFAGQRLIQLQHRGLRVFAHRKESLVAHVNIDLHWTRNGIAMRWFMNFWQKSKKMEESD
jgi:hypothetical protein